MLHSLKKLLRLKRVQTSMTHLGEFLFRLIGRLPQYFECSEADFVRAMAGDLAAHLWHSSFTLHEQIPPEFSNRLVIPAGGWYVEFTGVPEDRVDEAENLLSILNPSINSIFKTFCESRRSQDLHRNAEFGRMASLVAHDIRSPLSALTLVAGGLVGIPEEQCRLLRDAAKRISDIASNLLSSRQRQSAFSVELLAPLIEAVAMETRLRYHALKNVTIRADSAGAYGICASVDSCALKRTLVNLINNAVEALIDGRGHVSVSLASLGAQTVIEVSDNGRGIPAHLLPRLGHQELSYGKCSGQSGHGLGLVQAFQAVREMNGTIEIQSELGRGTRVFIRLPSLVALQNDYSMAVY